MPQVTQIIRSDGSLRSPTVEDVADQLARQAVEIATNGRVKANPDAAFTRNCMAQSKPVKQGNSFDVRGTDKWLQQRKPTSGPDVRMLDLLIKK